MADLANIVLILLMMFCAIGYFVAGLAMLVMKPPRIDQEPGEPTTLWMTMTYTMFVLSIVNIGSTFVVHENQTQSWWLVAGRILLSTALVAVLIALWHRHKGRSP